MNWAPNLPATLFRLSDTQIVEEIGAGPLSKMVRIAVSDPDDELWRYSINVAGKAIKGREIAPIVRALKKAEPI